jgi:V8-like Glu-specific endopeptidase
LHDKSLKADYRIIIHGYGNSDSKLTEGDGKIIDIVEKGAIIKYDNNTDEGDSGGPVFLPFNEHKVQVCGIHKGNNPDRTNKGTKITPEIKKWIDSVASKYFKECKSRGSIKSAF